MRPMELYVANVPFDEGIGQKIRPALVVKVYRHRVNVFKITSQYRNKSAAIRRFYYPIRQWEEAGLKKKSYVDTHRTYSLPDEQIFKNKPIGRLTTLDAANLFDFILKKQKNDRL